MKKKIITTITLLTSLSVMMAQGSADLDINNVKARINPAGDLFWDFASPKFEVPKGSGANTIYAGNLWIGGMDSLGQLHMAGQTYRQTGTDFSQGPIMTPTSYSPAQDVLWNKVWKVNKSTIDSFALGLFSPNIPPSIANWPGNGNTTLGQAPILAPFYDANNNGLYEPSLGDYPSIYGDQEIFFIYNDDRNSHTETGGQKMGIEIHGMAYAFKCQDPAFYHTIFFHYEIINRSSNTYTNTSVGIWTDFDIGDYSDDAIGCDSILNSFFGYNGDADDGGSAPGTYGLNPPAQGVIFLNTPMTSFMTYNNSSGVTGNPSEATDYYGYMNSIWKDSTHLTFGGTGYGGISSSDFAISMGWTGSTYFGDVKGIGSVDLGTLNAGQMKSLDVAYVFGRDTSGGPLASVNVMKQRIQTIQTNFNNSTTPCGDNFSATSVSETPKTDNAISVYPNPANDNLFINFEMQNKNVTVQIYDVTGNLVKEVSINNGNSQININQLSQGLYVIKIVDGNKLYSKKFLKQ